MSEYNDNDRDDVFHAVSNDIKEYGKTILNDFIKKYGELMNEAQSY